MSPVWPGHDKKPLSNVAVVIAIPIVPLSHGNTSFPESGESLALLIIKVNRKFSQINLEYPWEIWYFINSYRYEVRVLKISTKGRYALRLMLDLAMQGGETPVSLRDVSERQRLSEKYLEQIVTPLSRTGLVRAVRGAGGGYLLTKSPEEYTVGAILRTLEGELAPVECAVDPNYCERCEECVTVELWQQIYQAVSNVVDHVTLADLTARAREKGSI